MLLNLLSAAASLGLPAAMLLLGEAAWWPARREAPISGIAGRSLQNVG